jgi:hypothetical protein
VPPIDSLQIENFLLVDELENGIHWSVMPKLWLAEHASVHRLEVGRETSVRFDAGARQGDQTIEQIEDLLGEPMELAGSAVRGGERWGTKARRGGGRQA